jgi:tetratricopeptide (TPR) repeat protein
MDRRASLVLALCLTTGVPGCVPHGPLPLVSSDAKSTPLPAPPAAVAETGAVSDGRPHKPHAATYAAAGSLAEKTADDPKRGPADREHLLEEARQAYQQAIAADPDYLPAQQALARLYLKQGDQDRALATYQKALAAHPKEAALWFELGMCYSRQKKWDEALVNLRKAVELDPENRPYVNTLGFALARAGNDDESVACFEKISGPAQAHYNVARMLHHLKQDERSRQHLELALRADPKLDAARSLLDELGGKATGVVQAPASAPAEDEDEDGPGR